ncbi:MAG: xanthine dehydrogenase family protein molybdopterin-binding subunit [Gammaproteobacteria bacterium]|nr:xanthine dehydrogenase family protein molybdopterin-binding subunit [Gammaproteobacteria bacterium]
MGNDDLRLIGRSLPLIDGYEKVTGKLKYAGDLPALQRMHHARILRSPYAHARVVHLDVSRAAALPGVSAIITSEDGNKATTGGPACGPIWNDPSFNFRGPIISNEVCFVGDEVAAVSAVDEDTAREALNLIAADYEELPAVFDMEEAMKPDAPPVRPWGPNSLPPTVFEWGNLEQGFAQADFVIENRTTMANQQHAPLDRNACIASWTGEAATIWTSSQSIFWLRQSVCDFFGLPANRVRVYSTPTGGSFGLWWNNNFMFIALMLAKKAGRPVKCVLNRNEVMTTVKRRERPITDVRIGVKKDGTMVAQSHRHLLDNGAYGNKFDPYQSVADMYTTAHGRSEFIGVSTNLLTAGCMRGVGDLTLAYGIEQTVDMAAEKLDMDPVDFRLKNMWKTGDVCHTSQEVVFARMLFNKTPEVRLTSNGMRECITKGAEMIGWKSKWKGWGQPYSTDGTKRRAVGMGCSTHISGLAFLGFNGVIVKVSSDGSITLTTGIGRMGQAGDTTQAMVAAEVLGVGLDDINVIDGDTEVCPNTMVTYGSNGMHMVSRATRAAALDARRQILDLAGRHLEANPEDLDIRDGRIFVKGTPEMGIGLKELMSTPIYEYLAAPEVIGRAAQGVEFERAGKMMMANFAEVEVDIRTCQLRIVKFVAVHDSGTIVNPAVCENQVSGGMCQGMGMALTEHLIFDEETGAILNPNFMDYKIIGPMDLPDPEIHFVPVYDEDGPFGAKGIGEGVTCAVPAAVANAVYNAVGVRINPPITPDSIMRALKDKGLLHGA